MIYLSKGGAGADSDHTWIRPWPMRLLVPSIHVQKNLSLLLIDQASAIYAMWDVKLGL